ncbi:MAG TPA: nucleotidyltransferase domain-containing protein [Microbacterium sp.]|nr:nucleotidyltransferase domain-containing protein [Microbacterium sp.]
MDPILATRAFIDSRFPLADTAIIGGSTARGERTATSDVDLLIIGPEAMFDGGSDSLAATIRDGGEVFEIFAYTPASFDAWATRSVKRLRPTIVDMLAHGMPLREGADLDALRERWGRVLAAGPGVAADELAMRRYIVTDVFDDLTDASDPLEAHVLLHTLFTAIAELALLANRQWIGAGKHLARRLREWDPARAAALADPYLAGDRAAFLDAAARELDAAGGRLQDGHVR